MKSPLKNGSVVAAYRLVIFAALLCLVAVAMPPLTKARPSTNLTVVNNSNWEIHHLYLSPTNQDDWGPDQLNDQAIAVGGSTTLNISCDASEIKLVAETKDGCFLYQVVSCTGDATWTITDNLSPDCGN